MEGKEVITNLQLGIDRALFLPLLYVQHGQTLNRVLTLNPVFLRPPDGLLFTAPVVAVKFRTIIIALNLLCPH